MGFKAEPKACRSRIDCYDTEMPPGAALDWSAIDTVLLDMDGTLLDLRFDNWFWQELIPERYAAARGLEVCTAKALLAPKFTAARGTLEWYCIEHWSRELDLDIGVIKRSALPRVEFLPGAEDFLEKLRSLGKRRVLVTNAHPTTLSLKNERVGLLAHFDACYSTHPFAYPKEHLEFWPRLHLAEPFVRERTLLVDDSLHVLAAARAFGIGFLRAVRQPDSGRPPQATGEFTAIDAVGELIQEPIRATMRRR
jgi:putative hydrolase of the HAD superfamily